MRQLGGNLMGFVRAVRNTIFKPPQPEGVSQPDGGLLTDGIVVDRRTYRDPETLFLDGIWNRRDVVIIETPQRTQLAYAMDNSITPKTRSGLGSTSTNGKRSQYKQEGKQTS